MRINRHVRKIWLIIACGAFAMSSMPLWKWWKIHTLQGEIVKLEGQNRPGKFIQVVQELSEQSDVPRDILVRAIEAAKQVRDPAAAGRLILKLDPAEPLNAKWFNNLIDLDFGPLNSPVQAVELCERLIAARSDNCQARRKLLFYYAMTLDHLHILDLARDTIASNCDSTETYVYFFLSDSLRLTNGVEVCRHWLESQRDDERLTVAVAIHLARNLGGSIPSVDEGRAAALRQAQRERLEMINRLFVRFPSNQSLMAYALSEAIEAGDVPRAAELLSHAPTGADQDNRFWRARAWLFARLKEWDQSLIAADRALKLHPVDWTAHYYRAETLRQLGRLDDAQAAYDLSREGRALEHDLIQEPDTRSVSSDVLRRLSEYMARCGLPESALRLSGKIDSDE